MLELPVKSVSRTRLESLGVASSVWKFAMALAKRSGSGSGTLVSPKAALPASKARVSEILLIEIGKLFLSRLSTENFISLINKSRSGKFLKRLTLTLTNPEFSKEEII